MSTQERVIVFVDVIGSTALKVEKGDAVGSAEIAKKLDNIETLLCAADSTAERHGPSEGDSFLLTGSNAFALFHSAVNAQITEKVWGSAINTRISIGRGEFEVMDDGQFKSLRGSSIDLTRRILEYCAPSGVVVTEEVRNAVRAAGYGKQLIRQSENLKGFGDETFYAMDLELHTSRRQSDNQIALLHEQFEDIDRKLSKHMKDEDSELLPRLIAIEQNTKGIVEAWIAIEGGLKILKVMATVAKWVTYITAAIGGVWALIHFGGNPR